MEMARITTMIDFVKLQTPWPSVLSGRRSSLSSDNERKAPSHWIHPEMPSVPPTFPKARAHGALSAAGDQWVFVEDRVKSFCQSATSVP